MPLSRRADNADQNDIYSFQFANRIGATDYRPLHDRYAVIAKMLNSLING